LNLDVILIKCSSNLKRTKKHKPQYEEEEEEGRRKKVPQNMPKCDLDYRVVNVLKKYTVKIH
jgi:hypothetical protein